MKVTEGVIQLVLRDSFVSRGHVLIVPNVYHEGFGYWESDLVSVTNSGYVYEFEIKISRQDMKHDFDKSRHRHYVDAVKDCKGRVNSSYWHSRCANRFFYVTYGFKPYPIPEHAGHMEVTVGENGFEIETIKKAPLLHRNKISIKEAISLGNKASIRYWRLAGQESGIST